MMFSRNAVRQRMLRTRPEDTLPHVVTHQRLYIVPTQRGWAFLSALLLMLLASVNYALSLGYALCFLLTGLFAATLLHTYRNLVGLQVNHISGNDGFAQNPVNFTLKLHNTRAQIRHGIDIHTRDGIRAHTRLEANELKPLALTSQPRARGQHALGRLTLRSDWPLGLWTCWTYLHVPATIVVYPAPETNPPPLPSLTGLTGNSRVERKQSIHQGDVSGLRPYSAGDPITRIAWKHAARGQGLQVRTFDDDSAPAQTHLSLQKTGLTDTESQLARLCAWVLHAEHSHNDYSLQLPAVRLHSHHGHEQRLQALRALALHGSTATPAS